MGRSSLKSGCEDVEVGVKKRQKREQKQEAVITTGGVRRVKAANTVVVEMVGNPNDESVVGRPIVDFGVKVIFRKTNPSDLLPSSTMRRHLVTILQNMSVPAPSRPHTEVGP